MLRGVMVSAADRSGRGDVYAACLALVRCGIGARRGVRAQALGWRLQTGAAAAPELVELCASVVGEHGNAERARWVPSPVLRALLAEYPAAQHPAPSGGPEVAWRAVRRRAAKPSR
ncbi:MAG: hypothetical protein AB7V27_17445 [Candidatus Binatia bacterium]